jgi:tetratricopeptide (TPR) repeat protein
MRTSNRVLLLVGALAIVGASACEKKPDAATVHREAGDVALGESDWKKAADEFTQSLAADPQQEKIWEKKAYAHLQANDFDQADAAILKTVDFKTDLPKKVEIYRNLGGLYVQRQMPDRAEKYYLEAVKMDPKDDVSIGWVAEIYMQRSGAKDMRSPGVPDLLDKAIAWCDKLIAVKPDLPTPYVNKRIVLTKLYASENTAKDTATALAEALARTEKDKAEAAKADAEKHGARMVELKKQLDEVSKQLTEAMKNVKPK